MISMHPHKSESFSIDAIDGDGPSIKLTGNADSAAASHVDHFLVTLHRRLVANRADAISVDLTQLYFMNSSCLKAFASWIYDVKGHGHPYQIRLRMNPGLNWQRRTLKTLVRMAPDLVKVEEARL